MDGALAPSAPPTGTPCFWSHLALVAARTSWPSERIAFGSLPHPIAAHFAATPPGDSMPPTGSSCLASHAAFCAARSPSASDADMGAPRAGPHWRGAPASVGDPVPPNESGMSCLANHAALASSDAFAATPRTPPAAPASAPRHSAGGHSAGARACVGGRTAVRVTASAPPTGSSCLASHAAFLASRRLCASESAPSRADAASDRAAAMSRPRSASPQTGACCLACHAALADAVTPPDGNGRSRGSRARPAPAAPTGRSCFASHASLDASRLSCPTDDVGS